MSVERGEHLYTPAEYLDDAWRMVVMPLVLPNNREMAEGFLDVTISAYSDPRRKHHDLSHIQFCLQLLKPYEERLDYVELFLAVVGHDVIYETDPKYASLNESRSADQIGEQMVDMGIVGAQTTRRLILSTAKHAPQAEDEALLCAIDMAILAEPWERYSQYARDIRDEYEYYSDEDYRSGRMYVLQQIMKNKQPFKHGDFRHLNEAALYNMQAEQDILKTGRLL